VVLCVAAPPPPAWDALLPPHASLSNSPGSTPTSTTSGSSPPWRTLFSRRLGRPSVPVPTLLRLLYLKHRYQLGYQTLCGEVADSISWRRFCRIPLDQPVPHPTTLSKLVGRAGAEVLDQLNAALLAKLAGEKVLRCRKLRIDTTVIEADIDHPTDADLLEHAVRTLGGLVGRIRERGAATRTAYRNRSRAAGRRLRQISRTLRRRTGRQAPAEIDRLTAEVAAIARQTVAQAVQVARNARRAFAKRPGDGRLGRLVGRLDETTAATRRLLAQARQRLSGNRVIPDRLVSLADPDARPIRKGKPQRPTEFGYTVLVGECERGFIAVCHTHKGNPGDAAQLVPAVTEATALTGRPPGTVVGDRGFGTAANDLALAALGVQRIGVARKGTPGKARTALERTRRFKRMRHWRVGIEARISHLKRSFGLRRTRLRRLAGATIWVGLGIFAYNLQRMTVITG
jgi:transposase, IS5 family